MSDLPHSQVGDKHELSDKIDNIIFLATCFSIYLLISEMW